MAKASEDMRNTDAMKLTVRKPRLSNTLNLRVIRHLIFPREFAPVLLTI